MPHLSVMISQIRLLSRHGLGPTALPCLRQYAPTVYRGAHTNTIATKSTVTPARLFRRLPTRPVRPASHGGYRNASFEAGENDSGHISTGPNEGIFFFDSESVEDQGWNAARVADLS
jgi:hypothetical protein